MTSPDPATEPTTDEDAVRRAEDARSTAMLDADTATLGRLLDDELVYTHSSGGRESREELLGRIDDGSLRYRSIEHTIDRLVVAGDTAMVVGRMVAEVEVDGAPRHLDNLTLTVWTRRAPGWRLLGYGPTPLPRS